MFQTLTCSILNLNQNYHAHIKSLLRVLFSMSYIAVISNQKLKLILKCDYNKVEIKSNF